MMRNFRWLGMSPDGSRVTLYRFMGKFPIKKMYTEAWKKENQKFLSKAAVLDIETTGLCHKSASIIEIGIRFFLYDTRSRDLVSVENSYHSFQDPGQALEEKIVRLTGISDEDLKGQKIDWPMVDTLLEGTQVLIAHNAAFDRPFVDTYSHVSRELNWACSLSQIDWERKNYPSKKLEVLSIYHGFFVSSHRALEDADATLFLLSQSHTPEESIYLKELLENAKQAVVEVIAKNAPFAVKDRLKFRGYHWNRDLRFWSRKIPAVDLKTECKWMEEAIYEGEFQGIIKEISVKDNFKSTQIV